MLFSDYLQPQQQASEQEFWPLKAFNPGYLAAEPSSCSILINWLYLQILSVLEAEPVLI